MKQRIRLRESDLHRIIRESVKRVLKESWFSGKLKAYHVTNRKSAQQIMNGGFLRSKYGSRGGQLYGPGVYLSLDLDTSQESLGLYGDTIVECSVNTNNAVFLDRYVAQKYGNMDYNKMISDIAAKLGDEAANVVQEFSQRGNVHGAQIAYRLNRMGLLDKNCDIVFSSHRNGDVFISRNPNMVAPIRMINI